MTNKLEISRGLAERISNPFGDPHDKFNAVQELRALLAVPVISRQEPESALMEGIRTLEKIDASITARQARIDAAAQHQGKPVAWATLQDGWKDEDRTVITDPVEAEEYNRVCYDLTPLFTSQPAPVAVTVVQERWEFEKWVIKDWPTAPLRYVRDALPETDPLHGTYCDEYLQRAWVGWQARACLDKVKELNP